MAENLVSQAVKYALKHAKGRESQTVTRDDLLFGILQAIARFEIVKIGPLLIDFEEIKENSENHVNSIDNIKVTYSSKTSAVFDKAASVARQDNSSTVEIVHLLASFSNEDNELMVNLKKKYNISSMTWRSALLQFESTAFEEIRSSSRNMHRKKYIDGFEQKQLFSPDEAAVFLGLHTQTIRGYIRTGKLPALRLAGERALRIQRKDLITLLEPYNPENT